jgi:hypothetical protein
MTAKTVVEEAPLNEPSIRRVDEFVGLLLCRRAEVRRAVGCWAEVDMAQADKIFDESEGGFLWFGGLNRLRNRVSRVA